MSHVTDHIKVVDSNVNIFLMICLTQSKLLVVNKKNRRSRNLLFQQNCCAKQTQPQLSF